MSGCFRFVSLGRSISAVAETKSRSLQSYPPANNTPSFIREHLQYLTICNILAPIVRRKHLASESEHRRSPLLHLRRRCNVLLPISASVASFSSLISGSARSCSPLASALSTRRILFRGCKYKGFLREREKAEKNVFHNSVDQPSNPLLESWIPVDFRTCLYRILRHISSICSFHVSSNLPESCRTAVSRGLRGLLRLASLTCALTEANGVFFCFLFFGNSFDQRMFVSSLKPGIGRLLSFLDSSQHIMRPAKNSSSY
jgi:hypothetical protein